MLVGFLQGKASICVHLPSPPSLITLPLVLGEGEGGGGGSLDHMGPTPKLRCSFPAVGMLVQISTEEIRVMEREEAWQPTKGVPVIDEDITEVLHAILSLSEKTKTIL